MAKRGKRKHFKLSLQSERDALALLLKSKNIKILEVVAYGTGVTIVWNWKPKEAEGEMNHE